MPDIARDIPSAATTEKCHRNAPARNAPATDACWDPFLWPINYYHDFAGQVCKQVTAYTHYVTFSSEGGIAIASTPTHHRTTFYGKRFDEALSRKIHALEENRKLSRDERSNVYSRVYAKVLLHEVIRLGLFDSWSDSVYEEEGSLGSMESGNTEDELILTEEEGDMIDRALYDNRYDRFHPWGNDDW